MTNFTLVNLPSLTRKSTLYPKKFDCEDLVHWEMLEKNDTVDKNLYVSHSRISKLYIRQRTSSRQGQVTVTNDRAKPHTPNIIKMKGVSYIPELCTKGLSQFHLSIELNDGR